MASHKRVGKETFLTVPLPVARAKQAVNTMIVLMLLAGSSLEVTSVGASYKEALSNPCIFTCQAGYILKGKISRIYFRPLY